jgi:RNA polymerase sigma factor (sigma-70 family)
MKSVINQEHYAIMKKICYKNLKSVMSQEDMDSLIYYTYAQCLKHYDPSKGQAKFTTYLYHSVNNNSRKIYLKTVRSPEKQTSPFFFDSGQSTESVSREIFEILDSLKETDEDSHTVLVQKFLYGMTNNEIGKANGYCRESARQKVKKALEICREIVYS